MQFKVLGCGTSTGVPVPGCTCQVCASKDPKNERLRTSGLLITDTEKNILIDAGSDLRAQALKNGVSHLDAVLFTHSHMDHILGVDDLRCFNFVKKANIPCYGTDLTLLEIERVFSYIYNKNDDYEGGLLADLTNNRIQPLKPFDLFEETITPFHLWHGKTPVTGFRVRDFVYATDCKTIPNESKNVMSNARFLFLDALRHRKHKTHMTIEEAVTIAQELKADMTYLIHMSHDLDYHETNSQLPPNIQLAYDGLRVEF